MLSVRHPSRAGDRCVSEGHRLVRLKLSMGSRGGAETSAGMTFSSMGCFRATRSPTPLFQIVAPLASVYIAERNDNCTGIPCPRPYFFAS
jgi:hypothetical protein